MVESLVLRGFQRYGLTKILLFCGFSHLQDECIMSSLRDSHQMHFLYDPCTIPLDSFRQPAATSK